MKILITGGAGFIGSHLAHAALAAGHEVVVVDNLSTGRRDYIPPGAAFYEADIRDSALLDIFQQERPHAVCHHAAQMSVLISMREPQRDASINILGSLNVLSCAQQSGVGQFVFASSGGTVYGEPRYLPVDEDHPTQPLSPYGISKLAFEHYLRVLQPMPTTVLRYANVYGPRQSPHGEAGVIAIFTERMLQNQSTVIYGDGEQMRDFVFVEDVAAANLAALEKGIGGVFNIGTGITTSVNQIFDLVKAACAYPQPQNHQPAKAGEVYKIALACHRAYQELGWQPKVTIETGIERTTAFFRAVLG